MDDADRAAANEQSLLDAQIAATRRRAARSARSLVCLSCGEGIPPMRADALHGPCLCDDCQRAFDEGMGR